MFRRVFCFFAAFELLFEFKAGNIARVMAALDRVQATAHYNFFLSRKKPFFAAHRDGCGSEELADELVTTQHPALARCGYTLTFDVQRLPRRLLQANETHKQLLFREIIERCQQQHLASLSPFGNLVRCGLAGRI